ncbi:MAG: hypothetical protein AAGF25_13405, partial [Pseudomonadota bacterium]
MPDLSDLAAAENLKTAAGATLPAVFARVVAGTILVLAAGPFGSVNLLGKEVAVPTSNTSAGFDQPAEFTGFDARGFSGLRLFSLICGTGTPMATTLGNVHLVFEP